VRPEEVQKRGLYIDHDGRLGNGWTHVRGLICGRCNSNLRFVDNGYKDPTPEQLRYLEASWFLTHLPDHEHPWIPVRCRNKNEALSTRTPRPTELHPLPYRRAVA
jgi:hypothetical protein